MHGEGGTRQSRRTNFRDGPEHKTTETFARIIPLVTDFVIGGWEGCLGLA